MKLTNKHNLPAPLVAAVARQIQAPSRPGILRVTELVGPPRLAALKRRHWDNLEADASEFVWALFGSAVHHIIEQGSAQAGNVHADRLTEERLSMPAGLGYTVTGTPDDYGPENGGTVTDWKVTKAFSLVGGIKPEWEAQPNAYRRLLVYAGFHVEQLRIVALVKDWNRFRAAKEPDYPQADVVSVPVPVWSDEDSQLYFPDRVRALVTALELADDALPLCTPEERWQRPEVYAVKKRGSKRAMPGGLQPTMDAAAAFASLAGVQVEIEHRPGLDVRCLSYCPVRAICVHGRSLAAGNPESAENGDL